MGDEYPEAEIIGIDLSPIQPTWIPPNVRFLVDDAEADWTYAPNSLDFVHARHVCMAIKNWPRLIQQAYEYVSTLQLFLISSSPSAMVCVTGETVR